MGFSLPRSEMALLDTGLVASFPAAFHQSCTMTCSTRGRARKEGCIICCTSCWKGRQFDKGCQSTKHLGGQGGQGHVAPRGWHACCCSSGIVVPSKALRLDARAKRSTQAPSD